MNTDGQYLEVKGNSTVQRILMHTGSASIGLLSKYVQHLFENLQIVKCIFFVAGVQDKLCHNYNIEQLLNKLLLVPFVSLPPGQSSAPQLLRDL